MQLFLKTNKQIFYDIRKANYRSLLENVVFKVPHSPSDDGLNIKKSKEKIKIFIFSILSAVSMTAVFNYNFSSY